MTKQKTLRLPQRGVLKSHQNTNIVLDNSQCIASFSSDLIHFEFNRLLIHRIFFRNVRRLFAGKDGDNTFTKTPKSGKVQKPSSSIPFASILGSSFSESSNIKHVAPASDVFRIRLNPFEKHGEWKSPAFLVPDFGVP
ncbi:hypothetical protein AVEN_217382-1 [Araneus ventricosus]|uniref:Uncharacterized protein n=1 Tax=Araneus ventricosus TaxID=182803 RepID=A0A4Y2HX14_ARAVE|nr:hypothetical protein AVEN_217382-1 [Araneus ventricosus]